MKEFEEEGIENEEELNSGEYLGMSVEKMVCWRDWKALEPMPLFSRQFSKRTMSGLGSAVALSLIHI